MTEFEQIRELADLVVAATIAVYWLTVLVGGVVFGTALGRYRKYHRLRFARELARLKYEWRDHADAVCSLRAFEAKPLQGRAVAEQRGMQA